MYEVTIAIKDRAEVQLLANFVDALETYRKDPFAAQPEATPALTPGAQRFEDAVPSTPAKPAKTTKAKKAEPVETFVKTADPIDESALRALATASEAPAPAPSVEGAETSDTPSEADVLAAFLAFSRRGNAGPACVKLLEAFNVSKLKELPAEKRAAFIVAASGK